MVADEFSSHSVPISPAATVLLIDDRPDLQVLMVKRTSRLAFAPDAWVFPGGRVDAEDYDPRLFGACQALDDRAASQRLGVGEGGLAWWVAVVRETLEEAGVLLGTSVSGVEQTALAAQIRTNPRILPDLVAEHELRFDCSLVHDVARFITPLGPPRRFDARFFVARMPADQHPEHDGGEIVANDWIRPADALERWSNGSFNMISPTVRMLDSLKDFESVDQVLDVAAARQEPRTVRIRNSETEYRAVLPGDEGYETARTDIETASTWLYLDGGGR